MFVATLRQKIAYNATFSSIARVLDGVLALIIIAYVARYLGPLGFGNYIIVFTFWSIFTVLADLGLYQIAVREVSQNIKKESEIISNVFTLRLSATALVFFVGIFLLLFLPYSQELKIGLVLGAVGFWALSGAQVLAGIFQKNLRIDKIAVAEILGRVTQILLTLYVIEKDLGFLKVILAFSISAVINFTVVCFFINKFTRLRLAFSLIIWKKMIQEGWPLAISAILVMVYFRLNMIILSLMKGEGAVGIFGISYKVLENLIFFPAMFIGLIMPIMSQAAKNNLSKFKDVMQKALNALILVIFPMVVFTLVLSDKIIYIIGGKNFPESAGVLNILIFGAALIFLGTLWSSAIIALGAQRKLLKIYFFGALASLVINVLLIYFFSYNGAAWATLFTEFFVTVMMVLILRKLINYTPVLNRIFKIIIATMFACLVIKLVGSNIVFSSPVFSLIAQLISGSIFYIFLLFLFKSIDAKEAVSFLRK